jgi:DNA-binding NarL/FixJ family response regulator
LEVLARARSAPHRQVQQAKVLLLAADGVANTRIADEVGVTALTVRGGPGSSRDHTQPSSR